MSPSVEARTPSEQFFFCQIQGVPQPGLRPEQAAAAPRPGPFAWAYVLKVLQYWGQGQAAQELRAAEVCLSGAYGWGLGERAAYGGWGDF